MAPRRTRSRTPAPTPTVMAPRRTRTRTPAPTPTVMAPRRTRTRTPAPTPSVMASRRTRSRTRTRTPAPAAATTPTEEEWARAIFQWKAETHLCDPANNLAVADLFNTSSPDCYKLPESWNRAGATHVDLANGHLKRDRRLEASRAYASAARCYKMTNINESISCLQRAVDLICEVGRLNVAGRYCKQIAELYESERDYVRSVLFYEKAADFYQNHGDVTCAVECKLKVAQFAASNLRQYTKAIETYEDVAKQSLRLSSYKLKLEVGKYLLDAGFCHLLEGGVAAGIDAAERYQELDPAFSGTAEYGFLVDMTAAIAEGYPHLFDNAKKEYTRKTKAQPGIRTRCLLAALMMKRGGLKHSEIELREKEKEEYGMREFHKVQKMYSAKYIIN